MTLHPAEPAARTPPAAVPRASGLRGRRTCRSARPASPPMTCPAEGAAVGRHLVRAWRQSPRPAAWKAPPPDRSAAAAAAAAAAGASARAPPGRLPVAHPTLSTAAAAPGSCPFQAEPSAACSLPACTAPAARTPSPASSAWRRPLTRSVRRFPRRACHTGRRACGLPRTARPARPLQHTPRGYPSGRPPGRAAAASPAAGTAAAGPPAAASAAALPVAACAAGSPPVAAAFGTFAAPYRAAGRCCRLLRRSTRRRPARRQQRSLARRFRREAQRLARCRQRPCQLSLERFRRLRAAAVGTHP
mmetsp:Transcript_6071/g.24162  ORF Transcript_6071/g.24162 Transcript_6071/m.24162 type:complete len:303 (-) Transcript_6071:238-1146(-)